MRQKTVKRIMEKPTPHWVGDGFPVRTMLSPRSQAQDVSPFLLLDYAAPLRFAPAEDSRGVGEHPHKGFETVTILFQGEVEHRDSNGGHGIIRAGEVQWMTAGSGVVHEEFHSEAFTKSGGFFETIQLWVNLPKSAKSHEPRYQTLTEASMPVVTLENGGGTVKVIAGSFQGTAGPAKTFTRVGLQQVSLNAGGKASFEVPEGDTAVVMVLKGALKAADSSLLNSGDLVVLTQEGSEFALEAEEESLAMVMTGEPINEPIASYGPFVMNTQAEIMQAIEDYQAGKMGHLQEAV